MKATTRCETTIEGLFQQSRIAEVAKLSVALGCELELRPTPAEDNASPATEATIIDRVRFTHDAALRLVLISAVARDIPCGQVLDEIRHGLERLQAPMDVKPSERPIGTHPDTAANDTEV